MRVTKVIREYIEKEVKARITPRYEVQKAEAKRQEQAVSDFVHGAAEAAERAWTEYFEAHFSEIADFCDDDRETRYGTNVPSFYYSRCVSIRNKHYSNSIHNWYNQMNTEANKIANEIIIELELGGTKAELMEMLNKI